MKCHICNGTLGNDEIKHDPKYGRGGFDPCGSCLTVVESLFTDLTEDEIVAEIEYETAKLFYESIQGDNDNIASYLSEKD